MRHQTLLAVFAVATTAVAQNWYVPDNLSAAGTCNAIPFGSGVGSTFANCKYQTRFTAADLGALPNLITGLGFAACATGRNHYDQIDIVLDHIPAAQPTSTTFASNLTAAATTVLSASNYTWNTTADVWNEIGLQNLFVYNGVDDVILEITTVGGIAPGGFHRATRERVFWNAASGTPPAIGTTGLAAGKVEISMLMARTSSHGDGCVGSNGTPTMSFTGTPQPSSTMTFDLVNGVPSGIGLLIGGTTNGFPFPFDLTGFGAPTCFAYTDLVFNSAVLLSPSGDGSFPLVIPPAVIGFRFFTQYAVLDLPANPFGFTTSNYLNVHVGN
jgi:hypothetical protein